MSRKKNRGKRNKGVPTPAGDSVTTPNVQPFPAPRSTKEEYEKRISVIMEMMRAGGGCFEEVHAYALKNSWGVVDGTIWNYLSEARRRIRGGLHNAGRLDQWLTFLYELVERAIAMGDIRAAGIQLDKIGKHLGAYPKVGEYRQPEGQATVEPNLEEIHAERRIEEDKVRDEFSDWQPPTLHIAAPPPEPIQEKKTAEQ